MDGVADEEEIDGFERQLGTVRSGQNELRRVSGVHVDDALFGEVSISGSTSMA